MNWAKYKFYILAGVVLAVVLIGIYAYRKKKAASVSSSTTNAGGTAVADTALQNVSEKHAIEKAFAMAYGSAN